MNKKTKRKYQIAFIIWLVSMIAVNAINEYLQVDPLIKGITVGFWAVAAYFLFRDLMHPRWMKKDEEEEK